MRSVASSVARRVCATSRIGSTRAPATVWGAPAHRTVATLDASKLHTTQTTSPKAMLPKEELVFGATFTDHMLRCPWDKSTGWADPAIVPFGPMEMNPASAVLHYAIECFEGMKAYRGSKDEIRLFRPDMNMRRLNNSMGRLFLPNFDGDEMLKCIIELLKLDKAWVPEGEGYSLYVRPTGISTQATLGVGPSTKAEVFTICSPVGPYYPEGFKPVSLFATSKYQRAWPGGTGNTKIGGNYAPTILPQVEAASEGHTQVLWLFNDGEREEITEVGTMNFFILWVNEAGEKELVTAPLDGTILPGVTRDSTLELARQWGDFKVSERKLYIDEITAAAADGRLIEAFGTGTAAVVSPVRHIHHNGRGIDVPLDPEDASAGIGPVTARVSQALLDIQYGRVESEWSVVVA